MRETLCPYVYSSPGEKSVKKNVYYLNIKRLYFENTDSSPGEKVGVIVIVWVLYHSTLYRSFGGRRRKGGEEWN